MHANAMFYPDPNSVPQLFGVSCSLTLIPLPYVMLKVYPSIRDKLVGGNGGVSSDEREQRTRNGEVRKWY